VIRAADHLANLLAVIHRDGGHHQDAVGTDRAVADACVKLGAMRRDIERQRALILQLAERIAAASDVLGRIAERKERRNQ
jgi:hypothetical protein